MLRPGTEDNHNDQELCEAGQLKTYVNPHHMGSIELHRNPHHIKSIGLHGKQLHGNQKYDHKCQSNIYVIFLAKHSQQYLFAEKQIWCKYYTNIQDEYLL